MIMTTSPTMSGESQTECSVSRMSSSAPTAAKSSTMNPAKSTAPPAAISPAPVATCDTFWESSAFASWASWCTRVCVSRHRSAKSPISERPCAYSRSGKSCCGIDAIECPLLNAGHGGEVGLALRLAVPTAGLEEARREKPRGRGADEERDRLAARERFDFTHHAVQVFRAQRAGDALQPIGCPFGHVRRRAFAAVRFARRFAQCPGEASEARCRGILLLCQGRTHSLVSVFHDVARLLLRSLRCTLQWVLW